MRRTEARFALLIAARHATDADRSTTRLGDWYVDVLFWKPQVALFVSETTLLPVLVPFAPAATLLDRFPVALLACLQAHEVPRRFTDPELAAMQHRRLAKTASHSVLGVMNEFRFLGGIYFHEDGETDLLALSLRLAETPASRCTNGTSAPIANSRPSSHPPRIHHHPHNPTQRRSPARNTAGLSCVWRTSACIDVPVDPAARAVRGLADRAHPRAVVRSCCRGCFDARARTSGRIRDRHPRGLARVPP
jgi:hypothetical protein